MLVIRLARGGAKKRPFYHVVVAEKSSPRDGRFVERIGFANPMAAGKAEPLRIDLARFEHWTGIGAHPSPAVARLARKQRRILNAESEKPDAKPDAKADKSAAAPKKPAAKPAGKSSDKSAAASKTAGTKSAKKEAAPKAKAAAKSAAAPKKKKPAKSDSA